ncbi:MAG: Holliday junction resolvase RuvX [Oleiphilaceae bacterium]|nr:Holliday junction resolvase RuvX [Oleiphilaceae bacterium]
MPDHQAQQILAFDFGLKRFGVAVGNTLIHSTRELLPVKARDGIPDWTHIEQYVNEWRPKGFVVGLPLNMDGSESDMSLRVKKFGKRLKGRFNLPVAFMDERLSSYEAKQQVKERQGYTDFGAHSVDGAAACLILTSWFNEHGTFDTQDAHHA